MDGVLAFEITKQLTNTEKNLANVILLDSFFNYHIAVRKTISQGSELNNINYRYCSRILSKPYMNIVLFKATKPVPIDLLSHQSALGLKNIYNIHKFYANNTKHNFLDKVLNEKEFETIYMNYSHISWIKDYAEIKKICNIDNGIHEKIEVRSFFWEIYQNDCVNGFRRNYLSNAYNSVFCKNLGLQRKRGIINL